MDETTVSTLLEPPLRIELDIAPHVPVDAEVMTPSVRPHLDAPHTCPECASGTREHERGTVDSDREVRVGWHREPAAAAAHEPARPSIEVGEGPVDDSYGGTDEDDAGHVPVVSVTKASMRSSSTSAS